MTGAWIQKESSPPPGGDVLRFVKEPFLHWRGSATPCKRGGQGGVLTFAYFDFFDTLLSPVETTGDMIVAFS